MLSSLHIENIAVIRSIDIDFPKGFSALTGETGAGKSIIIDSINLLLGKKVDKDLIRRGEKNAMVSGLFTDITEEARGSFAEVGVTPDEEGNILIQRSIFSDGRSQGRINGRAVSIAVLRAVASRLVNIHGQSDTHSMTAAENHLSILDLYAADEELLAEYRAAYAEYDAVRKEIKRLTEREQESVRYAEILKYQISDIDALSLKDGEEEELIDKKLKIKNSEKISKQAGFAFKALKGSEKGSVAFLLDRTVSALQSISDVIPDFAEYAEKLRDFKYTVEDIAEEVYASLDDIDEDPTERLNAIEARLDKISKLKRKYGLTIADVLKFRDEAAAELELLDNSEELLKKLNENLGASYRKALMLGERLHTARTDAARQLESSVLETLEFLDMPKVVFIISVKKESERGEITLKPDGIDSVEFLISANRGQDAKSIAKIASGGELARIMLALKSVIADKDGISTIVFDEIDAGVSGKTARKIGIKMLKLARENQVFCVTHSAQIASLADSHYLISKNDVNGATETSVSELDEKGRITELSRILGGISVTESQRAAAHDMLKEREIYKNG